MFISRCLCSFHFESSDHSLGPVEAELRSAGRVGAPAPTCASMAHARGSIQQRRRFRGPIPPRPESNGFRSEMRVTAVDAVQQSCYI